MSNFFDISSVVIIGSSLIKGKIGNELLNNLRDFKGQKFGVNPKGGEYEGIHIFSSITDLPVVPDIAVFAIPALRVKEALIESGKKGIKRGVIISAGFKETGNIEGEEEIKEIAQQYGMDILGPNCLGYVDVNRNLNLSFGAKDIKPGNIALISQSGAMAVALMDWAAGTNIGFSKMISMGNKAQMDENFLLKQLEKHRHHTKVIALYLESIQKGEEFYTLTKKISKQVPIVLIKSGTSSRGSQAASSHTGALASETSILHAAFRQSGIHITDSLESFFLWSQMFSQNVGMEVPSELLIITNAGGPGVMATDHTEKNKVILTEFSEGEKKALKKGLPEASSVTNPIDIIGDATSETYKQILENIKQLEKKRAILIILTPQSVTDVENIAEVIVDFKKKNKEQFIMVSFIGGLGVGKGRDILDNAGVLEYDYPKKAILAYSQLLKQKNWEKQEEYVLEKNQLPNDRIIDNLKEKIKKETKLCSNDLSSEILQSFQIPVLEEVLVRSGDDIDSMWYYLNDVPLVAKIDSPDIAHKSDVGGIVFDITSKKKALDAYHTIMSNIGEYMPEVNIKGIKFAKMIESRDQAKEIFVGFKRDESFGNVLLVGAGGIFVNVYNDVNRRIGIVSKKEIENMLKQLVIYPILKGIRGQKSINFDSLIDTIYKLQYIFLEFEGIKEIDINPIVCDQHGSIIVDTKFYLDN